MTLDLLHPAFLWLLLPLVGLRFFPRRLPWSSTLALRALALACIVLALARPVLVRKEEAVYQVLVLDQSESVAAALREETIDVLRAWRRQLDSTNRAAIICIGAQEAPPEAEGVPVVLLGTRYPATPLDTALEAALRRIPNGSAGALTLVTDGLATERHWGPALQQLASRGIPVKVVDLGRDTRTLRPVDVQTPTPLRVGQTAQVVVDLVGDAPRAVVRLTDHTGRELASSAPLACTGRTRVTLEFEPTTAGFLETTIAVLNADTLQPASATPALSRTLVIQEPIQLLYLGGRITHGAERLAALLGSGFVVTDAPASTAAPTPELSAFDLVMIDDRPATEIPLAFQQELARTIRQDGLGLLYSGRRAAFGAGGFDGTPIADSLPVDIVQRSEKQDPSTALVVIIDTSGSMLGNRLEIAKQVARLAIRNLKAHDRVGIVEFYGNKHWALPLQSATNTLSIDRAIGRMQATGGTVLYPAIEEAFYGLKNASTRFKHIILLTDGGVEETDYESLVRRVAREKITLSTVLVGGQAQSRSLLNMANWGRGRFYSASDRYALPDIRLKQATSSELPAEQDGRFPVRALGGRAWWTDVGDPVPPLSGYVETQLRAGAELLLDVADAGVPVLATWPNGAGRVTALMTEPLAEASREWQSWPDYGRWLARIATRTARDQPPFAFSLERRGEQLTVIARRLTADETLRPHITLIGPSGPAETATALARVASDRFELRLPISDETAVRARGRAYDAKGNPVGHSTLLADDATKTPERQVDPARALDLRALAGATGGAYQGIAAASFGPLPRPAMETAHSLLELQAYAALLALLVYLTEIALRRRPLPAGAPTRSRA